MDDSASALHMLNMVVGDMPASLEFYRRLGVAVPDLGAEPGAHVQLRMPGGFSLELDTAESVRVWHAGWPGEHWRGDRIRAAQPRSGRRAVCRAHVSRLPGSPTAVRRVLGRALCHR